MPQGEVVWPVKESDIRAPREEIRSGRRASLKHPTAELLWAEPVLPPRSTALLTFN